MGQIITLQDGVYKYELPPAEPVAGPPFYVNYWEVFGINDIAYIDDTGGWSVEKWLPVVGYEGIY